MAGVLVVLYEGVLLIFSFLALLFFVRISYRRQNSRRERPEMCSGERERGDEEKEANT